ncbi:cytochrome c oxidase assembly protein [Actinoplanes sp. NPDC020271]|uniref:cytochrome c oxidase assembly protein n=1 Tax=Actinoplanes sp. NPDC020271 TaxID=3363896 RepID=UPI0037BD88C3
MIHEHVGLPDGGLVLFGAIVLAIGYDVLAARVGGWPWWRTMLFLGGCTLLVAAFLPGGGGFREHMARHLVIGMVAPLGLVLGAPVTLLLRGLPRGGARRLGRLVHGLRPVAHPVVALGLNLGGMALLYFTPFYGWAAGHPGVHLAVQVHFLLAGYLFTWVVAGPDPAPRRISVPARLVVLGVAVAFHATVSQLMYAGVGVDLPVPVTDRQAGATLMYYGGDIGELLVAVALVSGWRPRRAARKREPRIATHGGWAQVSTRRAIAAAQDGRPEVTVGVTASGPR